MPVNTHRTAATWTEAKSVFEDEFGDAAFPFKFAGTLLVHTIAGGVPSDEEVAMSWLKSKVTDKDDLVRDAVAQTMAERGVSVEEATEIVNKLRHLNGFKRDANGLYIDGRQLKSAFKEAVSCAVAAGKLPGRGWGKTNKGLTNFVAEHIFPVEDILYLGVQEPTGITQRFVKTFRGTGIQYEEFVRDARIDFTMITDWDFDRKTWMMIWRTGEQEGIGASRSQGFGRYKVVRWERIK